MSLGQVGPAHFRSFSSQATVPGKPPRGHALPHPKLNLADSDGLTVVDPLDSLQYRNWQFFTNRGFVGHCRHQIDLLLLCIRLLSLLYSQSHLLPLLLAVCLQLTTGISVKPLRSETLGVECLP